MNVEQLVVVAREFCRVYRVRITNFAALAAAVGLLRAPGIRETVLSLAPAPLREQLEKFL